MKPAEPGPRPCLLHADSYAIRKGHMHDLLSSSETARLLGVRVSAVKRWADQGLLPCEETAGRRRRFRKDEVERFRRRLPHGPAGGADAWVDLLTKSDNVHAIQGRLLTERGRLGSWSAVAAAFAPVLEELGLRWADGRISIFEEHLASERLARALARCAESMPLQEHAPRVLLATAEEEEHTLGLSFAEVVSGEAGAIALWVGRRTPTRVLAASLADGSADVLAMSASRLREPKQLAREARQLVKAADAANVRIVFGGAGRWPEAPPAPHARIENFARFRSWLLSGATLPA